MGQSLDIPRVIPDDWKRLDLIINKIKFKLGRDASPAFTGLIITGLTASRLVWTDSSKTLTSKDLVDLVAGTTNEINIDDDGSGGIIIGISDPLVIPGKLTAGSFASPTDVTNTRQYGFEIHYSGNDYDVTGIRSRAQLVTTDTTATAQGALLQAVNNDGINAGVLNGALIEAIGKSNANAATIAIMRGALVNTEWGDYDTITNLKTLHVRTHSRNAAGAGSFGTGYGIYIENEAVGGNGQAWDAGIYFKGTNLSAGNKAFTYGIDFSGGTYGIADIKLSSSGSIDMNTGVLGSSSGNLTIKPSSTYKVIIQSTIDSTTFFQILDADGGTPIFNVDSTNERIGIGIATPAKKLDVIGAIKVTNSGVGNYPLFLYADTPDLFRAVNTNASSSSAGAGFQFFSDDGAPLGSGHRMGFLTFGGSKDEVGGTYNSVAITAFSEGSWGVNNHPGRIRFEVTPSSSIVRKIAMTIRGNGSVGIGIESPSETLDVVGTFRVVGSAELVSNNPYYVIRNNTHEDSDGGRDSRIIFKGEQSGGEETTLVRIEVSHDGTGDDQLGKMVLSVNTGAGLADVIKIDSSGNTKIGDAGVTNYTQFAIDGSQTMIGTARVIKHMQFTMELGRGQSAPAERFTEDPYVSFTYAIGDDSHISREVPEDMDFTVASIVKVHWYTTDAGANGDGDEVRWEVQWASRAPGEDLTTGDTTDNSGDIVCSVQNIIVETTVVTIPADSIASGDMLGLHIQRVTLGTGNGPTGSSVHVLDVELEYTSNKLGKAT